jgi:hypothetical protein
MCVYVKTQSLSLESGSHSEVLILKLESIYHGLRFVGQAGSLSGKATLLLGRGINGECMTIWKDAIMSRFLSQDKRRVGEDSSRVYPEHTSMA